MTTATGQTRPLVGTGAPIELPGAPLIPGLRVRHWRDEADLAPFVEVINGSWAADGIGERTAVANEASELRHEDGFDIAQDLILVEIDREVVAFARATMDVDDEAVRRHWINVMLAPAGRGLGLEHPLIAWCEARHRAIASSGEPGVERRLGAWAAAREAWWVDDLAEDGYRPVRYFTDMYRDGLEDLPDRPLPDGLELRPVRPEDIRTIVAAKEEAFADHWGHRPMTEQSLRGFLEHPHTDPSLWMVAWDGEEVAGVVLAAIMHDENAAFGWRRGWLGSVGTRTPWRGRGLASALIVKALEALRERGMTGAGLGVDTENQYDALGLYARLGFTPDERFLILFKPWDPA